MIGTQEKRITLPPGDGPVKPLLFKQLGPQGVERGGSGHGGEGGGDPTTRGVQRKRAHVEGVPMATRTLVLVIVRKTLIYTVLRLLCGFLS